MNGLYERDAAAGLIELGQPLILAGDERLLATMPKGNWIGGTIPYFMGDQGGVETADRIFVTKLPDSVRATVHRYDASELPTFAADHPGHGYTVMLLPAFSGVHTSYARDVARYPGIFDRPVVGWVSGVALADIGKVRPKVFDGGSGTSSAEHAVALHVELPPDAQAAVEIVNLFRQGNGDAIAFRGGGFSTKEALINDQPTNFASYLKARDADIRLPLVADYNGAMVNVSIQSVDDAVGVVEFYAPVFPDVIYRLADPIGDYVSEFAAVLPGGGTHPTFACNCILNYLYAGLERKSTAPLFGPMTFGEIAYMLLNQTAVYLTVTQAD